VTEATDDDLAAGMEKAFEAGNWRPGTVLKKLGQVEPNEYVIEEFINDWYLSVILMAPPHTRRRWEKSAFEFVDAMSTDDLETLSAQSDVFEVMTR
jgi:hypothetical protein